MLIMTYYLNIFKNILGILRFLICIGLIPPEASLRSEHSPFSGLAVKSERNTENCCYFQTFYGFQFEGWKLSDN